MQDTKLQILHSSFRLFVKQGFTDVSVNDIISETSVTKGCFYHHFKSKNQLIEEVFHLFIYEYFERIISEAENSEFEMDETKRLKMLFSQLICFDDYMNSILGEPHIDFHDFYLLVMEGVKKYPNIMNCRLELYKRLKKLFADAIAENTKGIDPEKNALYAVSYVEGIVLLHALNNMSGLKCILPKVVDDILNGSNSASVG